MPLGGVSASDIIMQHIFPKDKYYFIFRFSFPLCLSCIHLHFSFFLAQLRRINWAARIFITKTRINLSISIATIKKNFFNKSIRVSFCVAVCTENLELIWFSFTLQLLIGLGKVYNYFKEGFNHPQDLNTQQKKILKLKEKELSY